MQRQSVKTFTVQIFVGLRVGYTDELNDIELVRAVCRQYVSGVGLCVTVTPTEFIYTPSDECPHYGEPGAIIGLINYPRFPADAYEIRERAIELGHELMNVLKQNRVSVVDHELTVMLEQVLRGKDL